nr:hypothetical protein [Enterobacter hormaechei]
MDFAFSLADYRHLQRCTAGVPIFLSVLVAVKGNVARLVDHLRH